MVTDLIEVLVLEATHKVGETSLTRAVEEKGIRWTFKDDANPGLGKGDVLFNWEAARDAVEWLRSLNTPRWRDTLRIFDESVSMAERVLTVKRIRHDGNIYSLKLEIVGSAWTVVVLAQHLLAFADELDTLFPAPVIPDSPFLKA